MHRFYLFILLLGSVAALAQGSSRGVIRGTVLDETGAPVVNAYVAADLMQGDKITAGSHTYTDNTGQFLFEGLAPGNYQVSAEKQEDGYRSTRADLFGQTPLMVALTPDEPVAMATIRFPAKAAVITGRVRDARTGTSIAAQFQVTPEIGRGFLGTATCGKNRYRLLLPAGVGFTLEVTANGYKSWSYHDDVRPTVPALLKLEAGTKTTMDIQLEPLGTVGQ